MNLTGRGMPARDGNGRKVGDFQNFFGNFNKINTGK